MILILSWVVLHGVPEPHPKLLVPWNIIAMNRAQRPSDRECVDYHRNYVAKVPDGDILETLKAQQETMAHFVQAIPQEQADVVHAPYGWTVRQVIEHCVDAERVFGYRALRFSNADKTELPGWDENHYASSHYGPRCRLADLGDEYVALRQANVLLLLRLTDRAWDELGTADGRVFSVRTLAWLMAGHWLHHEEILRQRLHAG
jgi:hypothetical protein